MCSENHLHLVFHEAPSAMFSLNSEFPPIHHYTPVFAKGFQAAQGKEPTERLSACQVQDLTSLHLPSIASELL